MDLTHTVRPDGTSAQTEAGNGSGAEPLSRIAAIANELGAEQIAVEAADLAQRVVEGRFYVACVGQFKRGKSTLPLSLKGMVRDALREGEYCLVLDHMQRPSPAFASVIRDLIVGCDTPIIALARSAHMEDIGFLNSIFGDRPDRYELRNFTPELATAFGRISSERPGVNAENLNEFLDRLVELSEGNPGAILAMLKMATLPKYRSQQFIKTAPLYIDFRMNWTPTRTRKE